MTVLDALPAARRRAPALGSALLYAYAFLLPVQIPFGTGRLAPSDFLLLAYLLLFFPWVRHVRQGWSPWHAALLALFAVGLVVALVGSGDVTGYALGTKTFGLIFLMMGYSVLLAHCAQEEDSRRLLRWFLVGVVSQAAMALTVYLLQVTGAVSTDMVNFQGARVSGLLVDPNAFGGIVAVALALHLWTARSAHPLWVWTSGRTVVGLVLVTTLVFTFSRSAWIAFLAAVAAAFVLRGVRGVRSVPAYYLAAVAGTALVVLALKPSLLQLAVRPDQVAGRFAILGEAMDETLRHPVLGIGLGTYLQEHGVIVHSTLAWFATEFGLLGLVVLTGFLSWYLLGLWRVSTQGEPADRVLALAVLLAIVAVLGLSVGIEAFYQRYLWLLFAVAGGLFAREARAARPTGPAP